MQLIILWSGQKPLFFVPKMPRNTTKTKVLGHFRGPTKMMPETPFNHPLTTIETARRNTPPTGHFFCPFFD